VTATANSIEAPVTLRQHLRESFAAARASRPELRARLAERRAERRTAARSELRRRACGFAIISGITGLLLLAVPAFAMAAGSSTDVHPFVQLALYLGGMSLLPFGVMTLTSFLRIVVVLSFLRSGLGAQNVPPNMVIIALSLFLSLFVMGPTVTAINEGAIQPYQAKKISFEQALTRAELPLKKFMVDQLGKNSREEVRTFYQLAAKDQKTPYCKGSTITKGCLVSPKAYAKLGPMALPMRVVIPAFLISELKKAFIMGFAVLLPFLVIDMVVSNVLLSLGMFMLPPVVISLPFKILLFVLAGGWTMVVEFLVRGFNY
jgi:flagellar biosynthetic protein FliP